VLLGTPDEILIAGRVRDVAERIETTRAEARARKLDHGTTAAQDRDGKISCPSDSVDGYRRPERQIDWHLVDEELQQLFNARLAPMGAFSKA